MNSSIPIFIVFAPFCTVGPTWGEARLIHNEVSRLDLRFPGKAHLLYCFMCFLWQSNALLIFLLLGVSSYSFSILECCSLTAHNQPGPLCYFLFFCFAPFLDSDFFFLPISLFVVLYSVPIVSFFPHAVFWHCICLCIRSLH